MTNNDKPTTAPENDTVLAHINDPAPRMVESDEESASGDPHERIDDPTVLAHINGPSKDDVTSDNA